MNRTSRARPKLLIVDDSRLIVQMVTDFFSHHGFRVTHADDGTSALERLQAETPDVIVADILMPKMDGWRLFEEVRKRPDTAEVPFVFLTVERELPKRLRGFKSGADDYVTKPFEVEELHARVDRILSRRRVARAAAGADSLLSGSVEHLALTDLLQILSMNDKNCVVRITEGRRQGEIHLASGQLVHACAGRARGVKALFRMLAWTRAEFRVEATPRATSDRSIEGSTSNVVMDGLVALDEWNRWREGLPEPETVLHIAEDARTRIGESRVRPAEFDVMSRSKQGSNVARILEDSPLPDGQLAQAICSLLDRGILTRVGS